ncbi:endonuclease/exonuclease/phosphatase family metal-dependent hydrolase [Motilibacter rhizosphaerae]|uniref:Endonuclease/exonuclease/phosphatase family metal-dependent hydrolase n=1 Tax=Motilibacter rhizosphaerae TaxID=598652 RepID=A0A4Q7NQ58_9ACTN|nr:endonuclease/exonuclease/phosphatase family protein [Motilibacter rhizosphaerae]RZS87465.1 endonuclease/exonuclease/phosphatase family metal-dependent hydrolase [Motilibacter rhizosphaerae]
MRIATFNLLSGRAMGSEDADPEQLRRAVRTLDADVLALQEVDRHQERSGGVDQTALVAEAVGARAWRFVPALVGTPGGTWRAAGPADEECDGVGSHEPAAYGIALVSRLPVISWKVVRLRPVPVVTPLRLGHPGERKRLVWVRDEPRTAVVAVVEGPDGPVTVANTHLSFVPRWNVAQLRRLVGALEDEPRPQVLVGDLNMPAGLPRWLCREWRQLVSERTWPAHTPRVQLDHVLGRGGVPDGATGYAVELELSDHRALVVDVPDGVGAGADHGVRLTGHAGG